MARKIRNEVAVGITISIVLVLTIYIAVKLAEWPSLFTTQQEITIRLPYKVGLKGLIKGSPVHLGGVKVGHITNTGIKKLSPISTDSNDVYVFFTMKIPQQYQLRRDCILVPQSNMLGGQVVLSIEDLGCEGEIIMDGQTVELLLAGNIMQAIKHEFDPDDPNSFFACLKKDVSAITEQLQQTIAKLDTTLDTAQSTLANLKELTGDERIDKIIGNVTEVSSNLKLTIAKLDTTLDSAQSTLTNLKELTDDERIDRIISNVTEVSTNLKLTSQEVRRAPWKLLYKPKKKEFRIQALVDSAGAFAAGAERLDSTALRLQKLMATTDDNLQVDKDKLESMVSELETSFEQFKKAEQKFWEELK